MNVSPSTGQTTDLHDLKSLAQVFQHHKKYFKNGHITQGIYADTDISVISQYLPIGNPIIGLALVLHIVLVPSFDRCVGVSDRLQLFAKEQERQKLLCSSAPPSCGVIPASPQTPSTSESTAKEAAATPAANKIQKAGERGRKDAMSEEINGYREVDAAGKELDGEEGKTSRKSGAKRSTEKRTSSVRSKRTQPETPIAQPTPTECESLLNLFRYYLKITL